MRLLFIALAITPPVWGGAFLELSVPDSLSSFAGTSASGASIDDSGTKATLWVGDGSYTAYWSGNTEGTTVAIPGTGSPGYMIGGRVTREGNLVYGTSYNFGSYLNLYDTHSGTSNFTGTAFQPQSASANGSILGGTYNDGSNSDVQATWSQASGIQTVVTNEFIPNRRGPISAISGDGRYRAGVDPYDGQLRLLDSVSNTALNLGSAASYSSDFYLGLGGISDDGLVISGRFATGAGPYSTQGWVLVGDGEGNFIRALPPLPEGVTYSDIYSISGDGTVAVGWMRAENGARTGLIWDLLNNQLLTTDSFFGESIPDGLSITSITGVSSNGDWFVGEGLRDGEKIAWVFAAIPEPASFATWLAGASVAFLIITRQRQNRHSTSKNEGGITDV